MSKSKDVSYLMHEAPIRGFASDDVHTFVEPLPEEVKEKTRKGFSSYLDRQLAKRRKSQTTTRRK